MRSTRACCPTAKQHKTLHTYGKVLDHLMAHRHNRSTTLIALGGGVIGDITGFVAATYQRGVAFIQVPTTLLAQRRFVGRRQDRGEPPARQEHDRRVLSAAPGVGGPTDTLESLPRARVPRRHRGGRSSTASFATRVSSHGSKRTWASCCVATPPRSKHAVLTSCAVKAAVVAADEREDGVRAILNFGHTFGHAIETLTRYEYLHGEAVAIGMVMAADLSMRDGHARSRPREAHQALIGAVWLAGRAAGKHHARRDAIGDGAWTRRRSTDDCGWCSRAGWATRSSRTIRSGRVRGYALAAGGYVKTSARPSLRSVGTDEESVSASATDEFFGEGDRGTAPRRIAPPGAVVAAPAGGHRRARRRQVDAVSRAVERTRSRRKSGANQCEPDERHARGAGRASSRDSAWRCRPMRIRSLLIELIVLHVREQIDAHRYCLVLIDDAHLLELRALEQLLRLVDAGADDGLRMVFFAEAYFVQSLDKAFEAHRSAAELARDSSDAVHGRRVATLRRVPARAGGTARSLGVHAQRTVGDRRRIRRHARAHRRTGERHPHRRTHDRATSARWLPRMHRAAGRAGADRRRHRMADLQRISETHRRAAEETEWSEV